jgi:polyphosphate glucokinase
MQILVIDVGGTNVKVLGTGQQTPIKIPSGPTMTAKTMVAEVKKATAGWKYDVVSIGYPGPVIRGKPVLEPHNLAEGWVGFDFERAFGRPVKLINDAAMQALGSYEKGHMLFLGLGTGLGAAMIVDGVLNPMELAHLPYRKGRTFEDYLGERGLERRATPERQPERGAGIRRHRDVLSGLHRGGRHDQSFRGRDRRRRPVGDDTARAASDLQ